MFLSIYFVGYSSWKRPKSLKHIEVYPPYESVTKEQLFQIVHDIYIYQTMFWFGEFNKNLFKVKN